MARSSGSSDARIALALSQLPGFTRWEGRRPPASIRREIQRIDDEQVLMATVVELLRKLGEVEAGRP